MNILNVAINEFFKALQASKSSFLVRSLLSALALSRAILPAGWPDDYMLRAKKLKKKPTTDGDHFDFIVVGSGSAGAIVAARLSEVPSLRILLLEAGGDPPPTSVIPGVFPTMAGTEYDWNYKAQLDKGLGNARLTKNIQYQRGKVLGGSSSVNYLIYSRGVPQDYDGWNIPGWAWRDVLYYFKKSEGMTDLNVFTPENAYLHSSEGPVLISRPDDSPIAAEVNKIVLQSYEELGIPTVLESNGADIYGASRPHYTFANGRRSSTAEGYLRFMKKDRPNLLIAKFSRATKLLIDPNTLRTYGVEVLLNKGIKVNVFAKMEVVVSAGSIDTPKLLMLSGIGPRVELDRVGIPTIADLPVGQNFHDHVVIPMVFVGKKGFNSVWSNLLVPTQLDAFPIPFQSSYFKLNSIPTSNDDDRPMFQTFNVYVGAAGSVLVNFGCKTFGYDDRVCNSLAKANIDKELYQTLLILLHPDSRGYITLKSSNPLDDPYIETGYLREKQDIETLREGAKFMRRFENTTFFRQNSGQFVQVDISECKGLLDNSDRYWECYIRNLVTTMLHAVGTCRMGPGGVVDERLRVKGIRGLRIADASVIPEAPSGNTNAPTMMVGEKAADLIKEDYGMILR